MPPRPDFFQQPGRTWRRCARAGRGRRRGAACPRPPGCRSGAGSGRPVRGPLQQRLLVVRFARAIQVARGGLAHSLFASFQAISNSSGEIAISSVKAQTVDAVIDQYADVSSRAAYRSSFRKEASVLVYLSALPHDQGWPGLDHNCTVETHRMPFAPLGCSPSNLTSGKARAIFRQKYLHAGLEGFNFFTHWRECSLQ